MESQTSAIETPLAERHRRSGAHLGSWFGCVLPDDFGDWRTEYRFARQSVALLDKGYRSYFEFTGPDRTRFLNAILTNNIKDLAAHHANVSLFLSPQGHIQAEVETYAMPDSLFCVSFAMVRERIAAGFEKYIIMDDVNLADQTDLYTTLSLEGPKAAAVVESLTGINLKELAELEFREANVVGLPFGVAKRSLQGIPGAEFLAARSQAEELWQTLERAAREHSGGPAGYIALNSIRLEQGIAWFGYDFGEKQIPHEAGLQDSHISYTKGCYTGQEIVERVRSRGQVNRTRVSLKIDAPQQPAANTPLLSDGKELGFLTRTGFSPALNAFIGMGYARREKSVPGSQLALPNGTATVIETPVETE